MSLKTWLMPSIMQRLLSHDRLQKQRAAFENKRHGRHEPHVVHYFHQPDDPYSALLASVLPNLQARYRISIETHIVSPPSDAAAPEREKLAAYSQRDAAMLSAHYGVQPGSTTVQASSPSETRQAANGLRAKLGHYLGAMLYYGGEWYWGIDRLHHLETRLQALGLAVDTERQDQALYLFPPGADLKEAVALSNPPPIDFFFSFRSPYSAIVAPRVFELARLTGAEVHLRFVLPMVMRGLPVPRDKRLYIVRDTAREAHYRNIPFGRLNDPVGKPTERGLSLIPFAQAHGKGPAYVLSFMHGVWAQGMDAGRDRDLQGIVERAGLPWPQAKECLTDSAWRSQAEANREEMFALGLWGVPSFKVGKMAVWGQDRLWAVQDALLTAAS